MLDLWEKIALEIVGFTKKKGQNQNEMVFPLERRVVILHIICVEHMFFSCMLR
jgi:hypothetical protein